VRLGEIGTEMKMDVVGVYAKCRDRRLHAPEDTEEGKIWKELEKHTQGNKRVVVAGDMNAETNAVGSNRRRRLDWLSSERTKNQRSGI